MVSARRCGRARLAPRAVQRTDHPPCRIVYRSSSSVIPAGGSRSRSNSRRAPLPPAAFRTLARGAKKSLKRTRPYFDVPPFLMCDRMFRIEKIAAFGGGVLRQISKSKKGGVGGGNRVQKCPYQQSSLPHAPPRPRLAETRQFFPRLTGHRTGQGGRARAHAREPALGRSAERWASAAQAQLHAGDRSHGKCRC